MTFRSLPMSSYRLILQREHAYATLQALLMLELTHIVDTNKAIVSPFAGQVKRCDEALLKIHDILEALKDAKLSYDEYDEEEINYVQQLQELLIDQTKRLGTQRSKLMDYIENQIAENWQNFVDIRSRLQKLLQNKKTLLEKIACQEAFSVLFGMEERRGESLRGVSLLMGVLSPTVQLKLSKTIYRVSRGYAWYKTVDSFAFKGLQSFEDKVVIVLYPDSSGGALSKKLNRVMQTFCTNVVSINAGGQSELLRGNQRDAANYNQVLNLIDLNEQEMADFLKKVSTLRGLQFWRTFIWQEKLIYQNLNRMQLREHFIVGQIYLPTQQVERMSIRLGRLTPAPSLQELAATNPPTAFKTNDYTIIAQQITDTYGVPRYQQINPSIFTTVTFPLFFGVMFGDIGHGLILFIVGLLLVFNNDAVKNSSLKLFSTLRYMILMMGFFAFYCGWIYNDFLGLGLNLFGSCYPVPQPLDSYDLSHNSISKQIKPTDPDCIYPIGIDPVWSRATNQLVFVNSMKMKISVIIAIVHMSLGVAIKAFNSKFFNKRLDFWFQFIPQFAFLVLLFGYMDFLIIFKWLKPWNLATDRPPSIISTMMDIGLKMGKTAEHANMWGESQNTSQDGLQLIILLIAVICVPLMLLPKPIIEIRKLNKLKAKENPLLLAEDELEDDMEAERGVVLAKAAHEGSSDHSVAHGQDAGQIFVHQLIETIEFVLGAISNTASYLRLWALSLAHSQLAKVFFDKTLKSAYTSSPVFGIIAMPVFFYVLCWVTFGVLMCMDTMECFLHSLRLHWVEFQNKFYKGDGHKYQPISSKEYIAAMKEENQK